MNNDQELDEIQKTLKYHGRRDHGGTCRCLVFDEQEIEMAVKELRARAAERERKAIVDCAKSIEKINYPPSGKEYSLSDKSWTNDVSSLPSRIDALKNKGDEK